MIEPNEAVSQDAEAMGIPAEAIVAIANNAPLVAKALTPAPEPDEKTKAELERMAKIREFHQRIATKREAMLATADRAKSAKKQFEAELEELQEYMATMDLPQQPRLPFKDSAPDAPQSPEGEEWRDEPTAQLVSYGATDAIILALEEAGILTIGQLADWTKEGRRKPEDIPGIGPARAEVLADAMTGFWASYLADSASEVEEALSDGVAAMDATTGQPEASSEPATVHTVEDSGGPGEIAAKKPRGRRAG